MALRQARRRVGVARSRVARLGMAVLLGAASTSVVHGRDGASDEQVDTPSAVAPSGPALSDSLWSKSDRSDSDARVLDPGAAKFDAWQPLTDDHPGIGAEEPELRPFDWLRHWGFHHSSTEGRYQDKSVPLEHTSWLNRPYYFDWFLGPLISDNLVSGQVTQANDVLGGIRLGWDFDYYWGVQWRFAWATPNIDSTATGAIPGNFMVSDIDAVYYPWGDTLVRPFAQVGMGMTKVDSIRSNGTPQQATLLSMPFGVGLQFPQTKWLAWRLEIVDDLAFGSDGIETMNNFTFTAGMDLRFGARPDSYWPWRSSRSIW